MSMLLVEAPAVSTLAPAAPAVGPRPASIANSVFTAFLPFCRLLQVLETAERQNDSAVAQTFLPPLIWQESFVGLGFDETLNHKTLNRNAGAAVAGTAGRAAGRRGLENAVGYLQVGKRAG
jgi:hypothetical protein